MRVNLILSLNVFAILSGCSIGYDTAIYGTKTNIGLDIDTKPATAEISIARKELAIQPSFPGTTKILINNESNTAKDSNTTNAKPGESIEKNSQNTLPMMASFGLEGNVFDPKITATFSGGSAATSLVGGKSDEDSIVCLGLREEPDSRNPFAKFFDYIQTVFDSSYKPDLRNNKTEPFYFATDTTFGLKAAWSGTSGPYPDSMKLGYHRKEFASPPIFINKLIDSNAQKAHGCINNDNGNNNEPIQYYSVALPSFLATIENESSVNYFFNTKIRQNQVFATGTAAIIYAKKPSVQQVVFKQMNPEAAKIEENGLNASLITEIGKAYGKADDAKKQLIESIAFKLELFRNDLKPSDKFDFVSELKKQNEDLSNYIVTGKLNQLRVVAQNILANSI